jgi:hypothetical protein
MGLAAARKIALVLLGLALGFGAALLAGALGWLGRAEGPGAIQGARLPDAVIHERADAQRHAAHAIGASAAKPILFGDLHAHSTLSFDAMRASLPLAGGEGTHPQADACDFARYCSALDFWALTDHAESLTPRMWHDTLASVRDCQARAGEAGEPDLVSFLGWEWTQVGRSAADHHGHRTVILRDLDDEHIPPRPIAAKPTRAARWLGELTLADRLRLLAARPFEARSRDFARYVEEWKEAPRCPEGVASRELPQGCVESARDPGDLEARLREWGSAALVIAHGTSAGDETPADARFEDQLRGAKLVELFSGHGSAEEYRPWRPVLEAPDGSLTCPAPSPDYTPLCWRAGEIIRERCLARGGAGNECATRAVQARRHFLAAPELVNELTVMRTADEEWLDAGQCRDCFLPAWQHRPLGSAQYLLARGLRFGFVGSSDVHSARPGTGYKEYARHEMADFQRDAGDLPPPEPGPARSFPSDEIHVPRFGDPSEAREEERRSTYFGTGGLVAVHAAARSRAAIWDALERREVYATSGPRILLWFELFNAPGGPAPMGSALALAEVPRFRVRAVGSFVEQPGCPGFTAAGGLDPARLAALCRGECHHPSEERRRITRIEVVRIRPQPAGEPVDAEIEDPWHTYGCRGAPEGCVVTFDDPEFLASGRSAVYYVRAIEESSTAVNAERPGRPASPADDRLGPIEERAWSSPIFLDFDPGTGAPPLDAEGSDPLEPGFAE